MKRGRFQDKEGSAEDDSFPFRSTADPHGQGATREERRIEPEEGKELKDALDRSTWTGV